MITTTDVLALAAADFDGAMFYAGRVRGGMHGAGVVRYGRPDTWDWRVTRWTSDVAQQGYIVRPKTPRLQGVETVVMP